MKIPKFSDKNYKKCSNCGVTNSAYYISRKCLHKLCSNCYKNKLPLINSEYTCKLCHEENKENNFNKLSREDFADKPILEDFYHKDKIEREKLIYKRIENFKSEEEYNEYLEFVEKCLRKSNLKEIEKRYNQDKNEKEQNDLEKKKRLELIKEKIRDNSPTHYNNTKICIDLFDGNIKQEEIRRENDPITIIEETINYIKDDEKEKICGGYNKNQIYDFLSVFSRGGFRNKN